MTVQAAMARQNRGLVQAYRGELVAAEEDLSAAAAAFSLHGEDIRGAEVVHDRGFVAARRRGPPPGRWPCSTGPRAAPPSSGRCGPRCWWTGSRFPCEPA